MGLRVVAKWSSNGYFYSGTITQDVGGAKYRLLFDDGYECDVLARDVLLCDPLPLETEVTALSEDEYFSAGNRLLVRKMPIARGGGTRGGSKIGPPPVTLPLLQVWSRAIGRRRGSCSIASRRMDSGSGTGGRRLSCLWSKGTDSGSSLGSAPASLLLL